MAGNHFHWQGAKLRFRRMGAADPCPGDECTLRAYVEECDTFLCFGKGDSQVSGNSRFTDAALLLRYRNNAPSMLCPRL